MRKPKVHIDFETKSGYDIKDGRTKYASHPDCDILMMAYSIDGGEVKIWLPGDELPDFCVNPQNYIIYAHNAQFEEVIWNKCGLKYGFAPIHISNFIDVMALCGRYGLPQSLEDAAKAQNLRTQKNSNGKRLIKIFCIPPYGLDETGNILEKHLKDWEDFKEYCKDDVRAESELCDSLPADYLSAEEQQNWIDSCEVNARGVPIDVVSAEQILVVSDVYREEQYEFLPDYTDGAITKITQVQRIKKFINGKGYPIEDCTAETLQELLTMEELDENVLMVAEMRASIGVSSVGKYKRIKAMQLNGRIYDNQRYYGTHTGRWSGGGFQLFNLPRAAVKDEAAAKALSNGDITPESFERLCIAAVEREIAKYFNYDILNANPVKSARALIRSMLKAEEGNSIIAADYSSIEYVILEMLAGDWAALERFEAGYSPYVDQAAFMYNVGYDFVTKDQRQDGKIVVLGCGYQLGYKGLVINAKTKWGMDLSEAKAQFMVNGYRKKNALVVQLWYALKDAAMYAIKSKGRKFETHGCSFQVVRDRNKQEWLALTIPSGRTMYYARPFIDTEDKFGDAPAHWGINPKTKLYRPMRLSPGRLTENVVQALARDVLTHGMRTLKAEGFPIIGSIYDEVIAEIPTPKNPKEVLGHYCSAMCAKKDWCKDLPLSADGYIGPRYKKM